MHFSLPQDPLIYSFLLRQEDFSETRQLIVENEEKGKQLLERLLALEGIIPTGKEYILIRNRNDVVRFSSEEDIVGIFPVHTLDWKIDEKEKNMYSMEIQKEQKISQEIFLSWLSEHGYEARKSDEYDTYFRVGDTVSLPTRKGILRVSFFGDMIEEIFLWDQKIFQYTLLSVRTEDTI